MKFRYSRKANPPAPFFSLHVSNLFEPGIEAEMLAKVDTGADITGFPEMLVERLQLETLGRLKMTGFDRQPRSLTLYSIVIALPSGRRGRTNAVAISSDYVLLGRDVLNQLRLLLDGPALTLEILPSV